MKFLSAILLVLSSSNFHVSADSVIRGAGPEVEEGMQQQQRGRDLADDNGKGLFGDETPDEAKPVTKPSDEEEGEGPPAPRAKGKRERERKRERRRRKQDAKATANKLKLSLDDAQELLKQQQDFAKVVDDLQDDTDFLQAEMPSKPNGEFVIKYKNGNIPEKRRKGINEFLTKNKDANVTSVPVKLSLEDAKSRGQRFTDILDSKGYSNINYSIDGDEIQVVAKKPQDQAKGEDTGKITDARAAKILDLKEDDSDLEELALILVEYDDDDPSKPHHTYGGRRICSWGERKCLGSCTTAFSVLSSSGVTGISTAAHCTSVRMYDAVPPEADYWTSFQAEHKGWWGDVEWHTTPHFEIAEYYARATTKWPVRSVASSISKNQIVCGYSRMRSIRRCDRVRSTNVSVQYPGEPRMHNLIAMIGRMMIPGDSGGPWSYYDKAFGIVSGSTTICDGRFLWWQTDCHQRDVFSRASLLQAALGVTVLTQ